ncbi:cytochrome c maturation protein CcmE [Xanthomonadaceae bacterium JHOS43]|nr:cytochrome c maturation protein CcmE [Xanthomonadaceae bacterium JHOS43]MCX7562703.1 cytochrome c maturation protein CcmE [Xanthomonadaceae bacterium XH05]
MNPTRKRRLYTAIAVLVAGLIAGTLVVFALGTNLAYLYTPAEVFAGEAGERARFRLGGMVKEGSIERVQGTLENRFTVTDGDAEMVVEYTGILPDLFRENQAVIATGGMQGDRFVATEVLAKHDETYMPREVAEKMQAAHDKHNVPDTPATPAAHDKSSN